MKQTLIFDYLPTDANRYINAERSSKYAGADIKDQETKAAYFSILQQELKPFKKPVKMHFTWYMKQSKNGKTKDPDNVAFAKKFLLDGIVKAGILRDDSIKQIKGFTDDFIIDTCEQVIIDIIEV